MRIIKPQISFVQTELPTEKVRLAYAICYKNENKIDWKHHTEWIERKIAMGHASPCEHMRVKVPASIYCDKYTKALAKRNLPYGFTDRVKIYRKRQKEWAAINVRDWLAIGGRINDINQFEEADDYATVRIICNRGISHELVRHREMSFTQESTRYCNYSGSMLFIEQGDVFGDTKGFKAWLKNLVFVWNCRLCNLGYKMLLKLGANPQEARSVLPNSLKTEIWITGTFNQWKHFFTLRTAKGAHPQMRLIANMILADKNCPEQMKHWNEYKEA